FTGTLASINAALNGLTFAPTSNYNGPATVQITTDDQGNSGAGGTLSDTDTVNITINPVNDVPTVDNSSVSDNEDTPGITVTLTGHDVETADASMLFTITSLPTQGVLLDGSNNVVALNDTFTGSPTQLTYVPNADYNGPDSFT